MGTQKPPRQPLFSLFPANCGCQDVRFYVWSEVHKVVCARRVAAQWFVASQLFSHANGLITVLHVNHGNTVRALKLCCHRSLAHDQVWCTHAPVLVLLGVGRGKCPLPFPVHDTSTAAEHAPFERGMWFMVILCRTLPGSYRPLLTNQVL